MFISTAITAKQVAQRLGVLIGMVPCVEHPEQGPRWHWRLLGVEVILFDAHGLVNDCGIDFAAFPLEIDLLSSTQPHAAQETNALVRALGCFLAAEAAETFQCKSIVVENLQRTLATFDHRARKPSRDLVRAPAPSVRGGSLSYSSRGSSTIV